jgi:hypothetical protein
MRERDIGAAVPQRCNPEAMKRHSRILFTLGSLILTGCSQSPAPDNRETAFVKDWGGKDADRIAAH